MSVPAFQGTVLPTQGQGPGGVLGSLLKAPSEAFPQKTWVQGDYESCAEGWPIHHPSSIIPTKGSLCKINALN